VAKKLILYTDGASRGNPGPAAAGWFISDETGRVIEKNGHFLGKKTNNEAEYMAMIMGLHALKQQGATDIIVRADSELLIKQILGEYRVKHPNLVPLHEQVKKLLKEFQMTHVEHVRRHLNSEADAAANRAIDEAI